MDPTPISANEVALNSNSIDQVIIALDMETPPVQLALMVKALRRASHPVALNNPVALARTTFAPHENVASVRDFIVVYSDDKTLSRNSLRAATSSQFIMQNSSQQQHAAYQCLSIFRCTSTSHRSLSHLRGVMH